MELPIMNGLYRAFSIIAAIFFIPTASALAQSVLEKRISIDVTNQRLADVLKLISNKGNFYFSYNSTILKRDSLVTLSATNKSIKLLLDQLFSNNYQYREINNYIVLRKATTPSAIVTGKMSEEKLYTITGYVLNGETGEKITNASIYEKQRLVSTLSDEQGYFTIKLKSRYSSASLTISKDTYEDTTVIIPPKYNQQVTVVMEPVQFNHRVVTISPADYEKRDSIITVPVADSITAPWVFTNEVPRVEKTGIGKFLLSTKQQIQSINLKKFFADRPFQVSLIPTVGTQGKLSGQVINNLSLNVLGGYTGGVKGIELGGLFNINRMDVQYAQFAGLTNVVGGKITGVQMAGINNTVLDRLTGLQAAGINNFVKGKLTGWQMAGIHNHVNDSVSGVQIAGISNYSRDKTNGLQVAGLANFSNRTLSGVQISGILNYAKRLNGVQIGLINIADSSNGYSIGLINFVVKGYHKIVVSTNEVFNMNIAFKSGNSKLYSILLLSFNKKENEKAYAAGYGLGTEFALGKKFSLNPELTSQYVYLGDIENGNQLGRLQLQFNFKLNKYIGIYAGPSFSVFTSSQPVAVGGYKLRTPSNTINLWDSRATGWFGWNAGISLF